MVAGFNSYATHLSEGIVGSVKFQCRLCLLVRHESIGKKLETDKQRYQSDHRFSVMRAARFVTLCFIYSGLTLLVHYVMSFGLTIEIRGLAHLGVGVSILAAGAIRLQNPEQEAQNPADYGFLAYGMAVLSASLTAIVLGQFLFL